MKLQSKLVYSGLLVLSCISLNAHAGWREVQTRMASQAVRKSTTPFLSSARRFFSSNERPPVSGTVGAYETPAPGYPYPPAMAYYPQSMTASALPKNPPKMRRWPWVGLGTVIGLPVGMVVGGTLIEAAHTIQEESLAKTVQIADAMKESNEALLFDLALLTKMSEAGRTQEIIALYDHCSTMEEFVSQLRVLALANTTFTEEARSRLENNILRGCNENKDILSRLLEDSLGPIYVSILIEQKIVGLGLVREYAEHGQDIEAFKKHLQTLSPLFKPLKACVEK